MGVVTALCQNLVKFAGSSTNNTGHNVDNGTEVHPIDELLRNTCIALSVLSEEEIVAKTIRSLNAVNNLVALLNSPNEFTQIAAATTIANIRKHFGGASNTSSSNDVSVAHTAHLRQVLELPPTTFPLFINQHHQQH